MSKKSPAARFSSFGSIRDESAHVYPETPEAQGRGLAVTVAAPEALSEEAAAMEPAAPVPPPPARSNVRRKQKEETTASRPPSRVGKVGMQLWSDRETRKRLKRYAAENDRSLNDLLDEAVADFLRKVRA